MVENIIQAKDGYQLALVMLALGVLGFSWFANKAYSLKEAQDIKDAAVDARFDALVGKHQEQIIKIYAEHDDRIERLIEAHRLGTEAVLSKLCDTMHSLEKAIEKRGSNERL